jgi:hypothetical protein
MVSSAPQPKSASAENLYRKSVRKICEEELCPVHRSFIAMSGRPASRMRAKFNRGKALKMTL